MISFVSDWHSLTNNYSAPVPPEYFIPVAGIWPDRKMAFGGALVARLSFISNNMMHFNFQCRQSTDQKQLNCSTANKWSDILNTSKIRILYWIHIFYIYTGLSSLIANTKCFPDYMLDILPVVKFCKICYYCSILVIYCIEYLTTNSKLWCARKIAQYIRYQISIRIE